MSPGGARLCCGMATNDGEWIKDFGCVRGTAADLPRKPLQVFALRHAFSESDLSMRVDTLATRDLPREWDMPPRLVLVRSTTGSGCSPFRYRSLVSGIPLTHCDIVQLSAQHELSTRARPPLLIGKARIMASNYR
jgi:hypothetical protein